MRSDRDRRNPHWRTTRCGSRSRMMRSVGDLLAARLDLATAHVVAKPFDRAEAELAHVLMTPPNQRTASIVKRSLAINEALAHPHYRRSPQVARVRDALVAFAAEGVTTGGRPPRRTSWAPPAVRGASPSAHGSRSTTRRAASAGTSRTCASSTCRGPSSPPNRDRSSRTSPRTGRGRTRPACRSRRRWSGYGNASPTRSTATAGSSSPAEAASSSAPRGDRDRRVPRGCRHGDPTMLVSKSTCRRRL